MEDTFSVMIDSKMSLDALDDLIERVESSLNCSLYWVKDQEVIFTRN